MLEKTELLIAGLLPQALSSPQRCENACSRRPSFGDAGLALQALISAQRCENACARKPTFGIAGLAPSALSSPERCGNACSRKQSFGVAGIAPQALSSPQRCESWARSAGVRLASAQRKRMLEKTELHLARLHCARRRFSPSMYMLGFTLVYIYIYIYNHKKPP